MELAQRGSDGSADGGVATGAAAWAPARDFHASQCRGRAWARGLLGRPRRAAAADPPKWPGPARQVERRPVRGDVVRAGEDRPRSTRTGWAGRFQGLPLEPGTVEQVALALGGANAPRAGRWRAPPRRPAPPAARSHPASAAAAAQRHVTPGPTGDRRAVEIEPVVLVSVRIQAPLRCSIRQWCLDSIAPDPAAPSRCPASARS